MYITALSVVEVVVEAAPIDAHACGENTRLFQIGPRGGAQALWLHAATGFL